MRWSSAVAFLLAITVNGALAGPFQHAPHLHPRKFEASELFDHVHRRAPVARGPGGGRGRPSTPVTPSTPSTSSTTSVTSSQQQSTVATVPTADTATNTATGSQPTSTGSGGSSSDLTSADASRLTSMGFQATGINAKDSSGGVWLGSGGPYQTSFTNNHNQAIILTIWGPAASWVNAHTPLITVSLPASGGSTTISFAAGQSGAYSAVYPDTQLVNGQVSNTWAEYTFTPSGVVDVSRLVNANGHSLEVVGPTCTTNMDTCVFMCNSGTTCTTGYTLVNCKGSGAQAGTDSLGADSGGCGWNGASTGRFTATFGA